MDEPTVALDPQVRRKIWELIKNLKAQGITIVLTTHYIEEAENLCDRAAILNRGLRGTKFGRKIHRADKIKIPLRFGREIFLGVYDGEDAEIFEPNALVVNGAD